MSRDGKSMRVPGLGSGVSVFSKRVWFVKLLEMQGFVVQVHHPIIQIS